MDNDLTSVHDALKSAVLESQTRVEMINCTFKLPPHIKEVAEEICYRNGTTISEFLRECCKGLVKDYNWTKNEQ